MDDVAPIALGIDAGASSFAWTVRDHEGALRHGQAPGANPQSTGWKHFYVRLDEVFRAASPSASPPFDFHTIGLGVAGADRPPERARLHDWLSARCPAARRLWVGNDAHAALRAGADEAHGIALIAGTGSICIAVAPDGGSLRVGGWGETLGDEGSGWWLGTQLLQAAAHIADGRLPTSPLLAVLLERLELDSPPELIAWHAALPRDRRKSTIAALAPLLFELAAAEDSHAAAILRRAVNHLAAHVATAAARLDGNIGVSAGDWSVVLAGGLLIAHETFAADLTAAIRDRLPHLKPRVLDRPASLGALLLAEESPASPAPP